MTEFSSAMPKFFNTGNTQWDNGLNAGAAGVAGLFGDPSKQAQAGYYGAETAKALTETERQRFQNNKLYNLPTTLSAIPGLGGGAPPDPGPAAAPPPVAAPPSAAPPGVGTDGQPQPPDPNLSLGGVFHPGSLQPPGGGIKNAPPAAANGSPSPTIDLVPYMTQLAQTGLPMDVQVHMAGAVLNGLVLSGRMDRVTANSLLSRIGTTAPYESDQATTRTGMTNATTLEGYRIQGANEIAKQRAGQVMVANDPNDPTKGFHWATQGSAVDEHQPGYDSGTAQKAMEPTPTLNPNDPLHPNITPLAKIITAPPGAYQSPNVDQATKDAQQVTVIGPPSSRFPTGRGTMTRAELRQNPQYTEETTADTTVAPVTAPGGGTKLQRQGTSANEGATPVPPGTDAFNAQRMAEIADAVRRGDYPLAKTLTDAMQQATGATQPRGAVSQKESQATDRFLDDNFSKMFPVPVHRDWGQTDLPAAMDPETKAYATERMRELSLTDPRYRSDPNAAAIAVLEEMRAQGVWSKTGTGDRNVGLLSGWGSSELTGGDKPRYIVKGDLSGTGRAGGGGAPRQSGPRVPQLPPGALSVAPQGSVEGQTGTSPDGKTRVIVRGGFLFPLNAAAGAGTGGGGG